MAAKMSSSRKAWKVKALLARDGNRCWLCGEPFVLDASRLHRLAPSLDHVVPKSEGGTNAQGNLRLAHRRCNSARADRWPAVVSYGPAGRSGGATS